MYKNHIKRYLDILCAMAALIVFGWLYIIIAILVRINMGSPVIFKQPRPGKNEKIFLLYKFRTMTDKTDSSGKLLPDEQRLTAFGKFLRNTSLDELPEAINVLKGNMSIVGPRPLLVSYLPYYTKKERQRHDVRPGLTGLAQVSGRNTVSWEKRFELDVEYRDNITFMNDVKIIINTVKAVLSHDSIELNALENFDEYRKKQLQNSDTNTVVGTIQK